MAQLRADPRFYDLGQCDWTIRALLNTCIHTLFRAHSHLKCIKLLFENFAWGLVAESFARSIVE